MEGPEAEVEAHALAGTVAPPKKQIARQQKTSGMRWDRGDQEREQPKREREEEEQKRETQMRLKVEEFMFTAKILYQKIRKERDEIKRRMEEMEKEKKEKKKRERRKKKYEDSKKQHRKGKGWGKGASNRFRSQPASTQGNILTPVFFPSSARVTPAHVPSRQEPMGHPACNLLPLPETPSEQRYVIYFN